MMKKQTLVLASLITGLIILGNSDGVYALCLAQDMAGEWKNIEPNTRSITKLTIEFSCPDTDGGIPEVSIGSSSSGGEGTSPLAHVHVFGSCVPTDCDWGRVASSSAAFSRPIKQYVRVDAKYIKAETTVFHGIELPIKINFIKDVLFFRVSSSQLLVYTRVRYSEQDGRPDLHTVDVFKRAS